MQGLHETDLIKACRILFGSDVNVTRHFLQYIQLSGVKSAYRKKALDSHPDRVAIYGEEYQRRSAEIFREATSAYEKLCLYLKNRTKGFKTGKGFSKHQRRPWNASQPKAGKQSREKGFNKNSRTKAANSFFYKNVPKRHLRIGEFLYYAGIIPWESLISAITSQRKERRRIGEIASRWGWLSKKQVDTLLRYKEPRERLGDMLLRNNLITPFQLSMLLRQQQMSQKPIGEYLLESGILTENDLTRFLEYLKVHNKRHSG
jgi:hypothetical protein